VFAHIGGERQEKGKGALQEKNDQGVAAAESPGEK